MRILIVRLSALGDVVMAGGLPAALRARHPGAHIAWLVQEGFEALPAANPDVDEVIVWPRRQWRLLGQRRRYGELWRAVRGFIKALRGGRFDLAIDAQGLLKSALWVRLCGAAERLAVDPAEGSGWLMTRVLCTPSDKTFAAEYNHLAKALGLPAPQPQLPLTDAARAAARALLQQAGVNGAYAALAPFTTRPQKHWPEGAWRALAARLRGELGLTPLLLGAAADRPAAGRIGAAGAAVDLAGRTDIATAAALVAGARLVIGVDTGLTHMGVAAGVPTLALFGSTCPYLAAPGRPLAVLYRGLPCAPCKRSPTCGGAYACLGGIGVDEVLRAIPPEAALA
ncbi:glycosyltransferase family 9 protein [Immundisolibacter sp.]|uniref:glycosyltransferase family 9 protein n=1 Tax=Immundisolibacter sp. TaxID=1934948 RepID=UPI002639EB54|nr:glycosyltransferase family 9 protein [Immundisolibacter sp.]MDD3651683.1 glycosyltransferase family 9 protein [Immundisolibacter sp.]